MKILESLHEQVPDTGLVQRAIVLGPENGAVHVSTVLVRVPARHEFPLHTHPRSEDCFFVLAGSGEAFDPEQRFPIAEPAGVWIPPGVPHGLAAGASGMLEIGFQSPPDPTAVPYVEGSQDGSPRGIVTESIAADSGSTPTSTWRRIFPRRPIWRHLDPHYCILDTTQRMAANAEECEILVVVARGAVELPEIGTRLGAIGMLQLDIGESQVLRALEPHTLVLAIRASAIGG